MRPLCTTTDTDKLLPTTAVMRAIMQIAGIGRRAVRYLEGKSYRGRHRQRGLGVSQETPCKTVWDLARFGSAKSLNRQARHRPLGSTK